MSLKALAESLERKEILIPRLKRFLSAEKESVEADGSLDKVNIIADARLTIRSFKERIIEYNHRQDLPGKYFHPSALGSCMRQLWFGAMKAPLNDDKLGDNLLREYLVFEMGTYIHVIVQNLCARAGVLLRREVGIMNTKLMTLGHADGILKIKKRKYLLEIKTANPRQFASIQEPKDGHKKQVHAYMKALDLDCAIILYFDKDRAQLKEFVVPFEEDYYRKEVKGRIKWFFTAIEEKEMPAREGENPRIFPCSFCEFSRICYDTLALRKWMAKVGATNPANEINAKKKETLYTQKSASKWRRIGDAPKSSKNRSTKIRRLAGIS